ncbi:MAG TPA: 4Fe-4S dicluster domain-containing protein [Saprospiraceae bacterium]|nr:4Fe-4S dicluster domain-containing protein [Saprospiraceae bacterium]
MKSTDHSDRRAFLRKGLGIAAVAGSVTALKAFQKDSVEETGEKVKLLSPEGEIVEIDKAYLKPIPEVHISPDQAREGIPNKRFVMVIDLARCKNLRKCHDACEAMHHCGPDKEFLKVLKMQDNKLAAPFWQPTMCFHCDEPPCVKVCPVDATYKRSDGIVLIDTDRCIGCRFCMVACPYSARTFDWSEPAIPLEIAHQHYSPETSVPAKKGTVSKCDFCPDVVRKGEMPHCVSACPNGVFYFGDEYEDAVSNGDETVRLSELLRDRAGYRFLEDLGTKPRVYYLPPVNRSFPFEDDEFSKQKDHDHEN